MQPQLLTGSKITVSINGNVVGAGFVLSYELDTSGQELHTIDNVFTAEIAPNRIRVSMGLKVYRTKDNDPVKAGIVSGGASLGQSEQKAFTEAPYVSIEVKDHFDATVLHIPKAWVHKRSASVAVGDFLTESWSISGIGFQGPQL
jgi:hypothetical protein